MTALDPSALLGTLVVEGARIVILGYDADGRNHALALRRAGNHVVVSGVLRDSAGWEQASADAFLVDEAGALVESADIIVVRDHAHTAMWRGYEERIAGGALVVFASARALQSGQCARSGMDVVLVTGIEDAAIGCRIAVHRDVSRRALARAVAYARTAYPADVPLRSTYVCDEADRELASLPERMADLLALTVQSPPLLPTKDRAAAWNADEEPEPAGLEDSGWFYAMMNRRGTP